MKSSSRLWWLFRQIDEGTRGRSAFFSCGRARTENKWNGFLCADHSDEPLKAKIVSAKTSTIFVSHLHSTNMESFPFVFCPCPGFSSFGADMRLACSGETLFYIQTCDNQKNERTTLCWSEKFRFAPIQ